MKNPKTRSQLDNYFTILQYKTDAINENLLPFSTAKPKRVTRGLIDGLGSIIKQITGNMDAQDNEKIHKTLKAIKTNQHNIFHQIQNQYSINNEIIAKFNQTVRDIQHNEIALLGRIELIQKIIKTNDAHLETLLAESILNQLIHLFDIILNIAQNIATSLTFCKLHIVHPSIINNNDLLNELSKISAIYPQRLPLEVNNNNIQNFIKIIKPTCTINKNKIMYFLTIPLFDTKLFELFYLVPIPTRNFQTIIPTKRFVLKHLTELVPVVDTCAQTDSIYLCPKIISSPVNTTCEEGLLIHNNPGGCSYVQLPEEESLEFLPEINRYLGVLPRPTAIRTDCQDVRTDKQLKGIFLFEEQTKCRTYVRSTPLRFNQTTKGQIILLKPNINWTRGSADQLPKLNLKNIRMTALSSNLRPVKEIPENTSDTWHLTGTATLYLIITIVGCYLGFRHFTKKKEEHHSTLDVGDAQF